MFQVVFAVLALVAASIHLGASSSRRSSKAATYLLYLLVIYVGMMGLLTAYAQCFVRRKPQPLSGGRPVPMNMK